MKTVKIVRLHSGFAYEVGETPKVSEEVAKKMIDAGVAKEVEEKEKAVDKTGKENAKL